MKHLYILFTLVSSLAFCQDSIQPKIEGIGGFKINKTTTSIIKELEKTLNIQTIRTNSMDYVFSQDKMAGNYILELYRDSVNTYNSPTYAPALNEVKVYKVKGVKVAEIELTEMYLHFYRDTLIEINCGYTMDLIDAIRTKYGNGTSEIKEKDIQCSSKIAGTFTVKEQTSYERWQNNNIEAVSCIHKYYNSKCEENFVSYIQVSDHARTLFISVETRNYEKKKRELETQKKKELLKEF
jgi:hypothetical protein